MMTNLTVKQLKALERMREANAKATGKKYIKPEERTELDKMQEFCDFMAGKDEQ